MKKVYAHAQYETTSERPLQLVKHFYTFAFSDGNVKRIIYKELCNFFRKEIGTDRVLGFTIDKEFTHVVIIAFDVEATDDNYYQTFIDEEEKNYYIEVEE